MLHESPTKIFVYSLRVIQAFSQLIKWQHQCYDVWIALQFGHFATELSTRTTSWVFGPISWNAPYSGVQLKETMRPNEQPPVSSASFHETPSKISLQKLDPDKHKNQSINSIEQNNLHKNIIINTISHFSVSPKWLELQISEISRFARKKQKDSTNQLNYVWFAHHCFSTGSQVQSDSFAIFYNHNWLTYHQKDERLCGQQQQPFEKQYCLFNHNLL